ncbi:hypothetical protein ACHAW6_011241 [Cyclotella cf. meneghiniana]
MDEKRILESTLLHWQVWCKSTGKALRSLTELIRTWASLTKKENIRRCRESHARRIVRTRRLQSTLEKCLCYLALRKLSNSKLVERLLSESHNAVSISFGYALLEKLDHQLHGNKNLRLLEEDEEPIRRRAISLTRDDADCLNLLKMLHSVLYQGSADKPKGSMNIFPVEDFPYVLPTTKFNDVLNSKTAKVAKRSAPLVDLAGLSDSIQQVRKERTCIFDKGLIQDNVSSGINDDPLFSSMREDDIALSYCAALDEGDRNTSSDTDDIFDLPVLNEGEMKQSQQFFRELLAIQTSDPTRSKNSTNPVSLVESIATAAKDNLAVMKLDVDKSLRDVRNSEIHLLNYNDFVEKKQMQLVQCLRDLQEHCCTCKGPHIAKPPFSHGKKKYRTEHIHTKTQTHKCDFLRRKRREQKWLDDTLAKYDKNQERFKREIADREDEIRLKKVIMKDALATSLRLMDMM